MPSVRISSPRRSARPLVTGLVTFALIACQPKADNPTSESTAASPPPPATTTEQPAWTLTELGYGPLKVGLTFAAANDSLKGMLKSAPSANLSECDYVKWEGGPVGLNVMVIEGKIARVDATDSSAIATAEGARIGDSEERIQSLYANRVTVTNHKYEDGHYLTVRAANAADTLHVIIFETAKGKVTRFRGGAKPGVEYVEGCS